MMSQKREMRRLRASRRRSRRDVFCNFWVIDNELWRAGNSTSNMSIISYHTILSRTGSQVHVPLSVSGCFRPFVTA